MTKIYALLEGVEVMHRAFGSEISTAVLRLYSDLSRTIEQPIGHCLTQLVDIGECLGNGQALAASGNAGQPGRINLRKPAISKHEFQDRE